MDSPAHRGPVTIRDIAALTGFSTAAVSMALRDSPKISREARKQIREAAEKAGYRPNPLMAAHWQTVRARKEPSYHSTIAILNDHAALKTWRGSPWGGQIMESFSRRATDLGYLTEEFLVGHPEDAGRKDLFLQTTKVMRARGISAYAVLFCAHPRCFVENQEHFHEFAGVFINSQHNLSLQEDAISSGHLPFHRVNADRYGNMMVLLAHLSRLGYTRPGYWPSHWMEAVNAGDGAAAFNFWIRNLPQKNRIPVLVPRWETAISHLSRKPEFMEWLRTKRPDVVLCENFEVRDWVREAGLRIPEEIGLAHVSLGPQEAGWSGINPHQDRLASAAADLLTAHLQRNERGTPPFSKEIRVDGSWVPGETTRS